MAQLVKCSLYNHKDLSLDPQHHIKSQALDTVACDSNPSAREAEKGEDPGAQ